MEVNRLFDLPGYSLAKFNKHTALAAKRSGRWETFSSAEFADAAKRVSCALIAAGVKPGDRVVNISSNCPEWNFVDMGIMQAGAVHVPVYPVISRQDLVYIINETGARLSFAGDHRAFMSLNSIMDQTDCLKRIIVFERVPGAEQFNDFINSEAGQSGDAEMERIAAGIKPDDLATIIYTSGTSGKPKGVMLSHRNIISNFKALASCLKIDSSLCTLSYLPLCHIFERMLNYMFIYNGLSVFYTRTSDVNDNIREVQPHIITTVPLLLEKIYRSILNAGELLTGSRKKAFNRAVLLAHSFPLTGNPGLLYRLQRWFFDKTVYCRWREALGGRMMRIYCGGAALNPDILRLFWAAGIRIYEGYGLTETSPVITTNHDMDFCCGTVGSPLDGVQIKISSDGEILTKGPGVMLGYYKDPLLTFETIDQDGWLHTGDIGEMVSGKYLKLTGRKKALFKTSSGEYAVPERIENQLRQSPFISHVLVAGANKSYLSALIVPDFNYILSWFEKMNLPFGDDESLARHTLVVREIDRALWEYNKNVFETERIEKYEILAEEWTVEKGELTPKSSLKRNAIHEKYKSILEGFYMG